MKNPSKAKMKVLLALGYVSAATRRGHGTHGVGEVRLFKRGQEFARVDGDVVLVWRVDGVRIVDMRYCEVFCLETTLRKRLGLEPMAEPVAPVVTGLAGVYPAETTAAPEPPRGLAVPPSTG